MKNIQTQPNKQSPQMPTLTDSNQIMNPQLITGLMTKPPEVEHQIGEYTEFVSFIFHRTKIFKQFSHLIFFLKDIYRGLKYIYSGMAATLLVLKLIQTHGVIRDTVYSISSCKYSKVLKTLD